MCGLLPTASTPQQYPLMRSPMQLLLYSVQHFSASVHSSQRCMFGRCASKHTHSRGEQQLSVGFTRRRSILRPAWAALQCMRGWDVILSLVSGRVVSVRPDLSSQTCNTVPVRSSCPNGCPNLLSSAPSTTSQCPHPVPTPD